MEKEIIASSRILIVDDQEPNLLLLERLVQHAGYRNYRCLQDSRQLLDQYRIFQPDLIVLDLMMPKLDGYAVMKQLTGWLPSDSYLPILVVSADVSRTARQKALALGAKDFLTKPIDAAEATLRIYNLLLTRWLYHQIDLKNRRCGLEAAECTKRIEDALMELNRVAAGGPVRPDDLMPLRTELRQAMQAMTKLVEENGATPPAFAASTAGMD
jgi:PleD family two-component response regulator